jgi:hypothetical protein
MLVAGGAGGRFARAGWLQHVSDSGVSAMFLGPGGRCGGCGWVGVRCGGRRAVCVWRGAGVVSISGLSAYYWYFWRIRGAVVLCLCVPHGVDWLRRPGFRRLSGAGVGVLRAGWLQCVSYSGVSVILRGAVVGAGAAGGSVCGVAAGGQCACGAGREWCPLSLCLVLFDFWCVALCLCRCSRRGMKCGYEVVRHCYMDFRLAHSASQQTALTISKYCLHDPQLF